MKTLRHLQDEDPVVGTVSNSLLWERMAVETGWGEFKTFSNMVWLWAQLC